MIFYIHDGAPKAASRRQQSKALLAASDVVTFRSNSTRRFEGDKPNGVTPSEIYFFSRHSRSLPLQKMGSSIAAKAGSAAATFTDTWQ